MQEATLEYFIFLFFALFLLVSTTDPNIKRSGPGLRGNESDFEALLSIKAEIFDYPDSVLSSWNTSLHFCEWRGVTCGHRHRRVVNLNLSSNKLVGTLSPFIGNLSFLHKLDLSNNSFRGDIPHQISHLPRLGYLDLSRNSLGGNIPTNLSSWMHLTVLDLSRNKLEGRIPNELSILPNIVYIRLTSNNLTGRLQDIGIGNMSNSLRTLLLPYNHLQGSIPNDLGRLKGLIYLGLEDNMLSGTIPTSLFNLSNLKDLGLSRNKVHGNLPQDLGLRLPQLQYLFLANNSLSGKFPTTFSNLSQLIAVEMPFNSFEGSFSLNGNNMPYLTYLNIGFIFSEGGETRDLGFLDTLTNCTTLKDLIIGGNSFTGKFPHSILNLSISLRVLDIESSHITGELPFGLGKFVNLSTLALLYNHFTGPIPADIGQLISVQLLDFAGNNFSGDIPFSLGNLTLLNELYMEHNNLEGSIPASLGNCHSLLIMSLNSNKLNGILPSQLFNASSLLNLDISLNNLQGLLRAEIGTLKSLVGLDVSHNRFVGEIPNTLGDCSALTFLNMRKNSFVGSIPKSLSPLKSIIYLDLSCNNLSGPIPSYFLSWPYLETLNLSFNNLEGEVPTIGIFSNTSVLSVVGNSKLCGGVFKLHLQRCPSPKGSKRRRLSLAMIVIISIACAMIVVLSIALCFYLLCSQKKRKDASSGLPLINPFLEVSYQMLLRATNGFSPSNLIGVGEFGSVYKGTLLQDGTELIVAVKVMKLQSEGAGKSFLAECKALRNIRHRNLVKIITACSSIDTQRNDFKALIYEFMPMGNLEGWLYPNHVSSEHVGDDQSRILSLVQRLNIVIDVASALEYLHIGCDNPIIHCDLKPTNILLDGEMTARVGDFGLSKFLSGASTSSITSQTSSNQVRGTIGYAAPEYGLGSKASVEGDIYSFGIVVLEMMTSKKPIDPMFIEDLNLHEFVKAAFPNHVMEIIDQRMLGDSNTLRAITSADIKEIECIKLLIRVGVQCSMELPQDRMSINDVVNELKSAKRNILPTLKKTYRPV